MHNGYHARWISKERVHSLRKFGQLRQGILLDSFKGFIIVEPSKAQLGDGKLLTQREADTELHPAWCLDSQSKISRARSLLHLGNPVS